MSFGASVIPHGLSSVFYTVLQTQQNSRFFGYNLSAAGSDACWIRLQSQVVMFQVFSDEDATNKLL